MNTLQTSYPASTHQLLTICAVPNWFDANVLGALHDDIEQGLTGFKLVCKLPSVRADQDHPGYYVLDPQTRAKFLTELTDEQMPLYKVLQRRAFDYFAERLSITTGDEQALCADALMFHLDELFYLDMDTRDLPELAQILALTAQLPLNEPAHRHLLAYYQGCLYNEQMQHPLAATTFLHLLQESALSNNLRARVFTALGFNYEYQGLWGKAVEAHRQSQMAYANNKDLQGVAKALSNRGIVSHRLMEYQQALELFESSYRLAQEMGDTLHQGRVLSELGYTAKELGQWDSALDYYEQSMEIWQQLELPESEARIHNNMGEIHHLCSRWREAEAHYERALQIALDKRHENKREASDMLLNLGFLFCTEFKYQEAQEKFDHALQIAQEIADQPAISRIHYHLGDLWRRRGDLQRARQEFGQSIDIIENLRSTITEQETQTSLLGTFQQTYQAIVLLCLDLKQIEEALHYIERAKSRVFLDTLAQASNSQALDDALPLTAAEIQQRLSADEVLIEFFITGLEGPRLDLLKNLPPASRHLRDSLVTPDKMLAFVVTHERIDLVELYGSEPQIRAQHFDETSGRLIGANAPTLTNSATSVEPLASMTHWHDLGRQLFEPLRPYLSGKQHIYLAPHSLLHLLPLHALPTDGQFNDQPDATISYAPSASVLFKLKLEKEHTRREIRCLSVGVNLDALKHSEAEAERIAKLLSGRVLAGASASLDQVRAFMTDYNVLHFSCHGQFHQRAPMASSLVLYDGELTANDIQQSIHLNADLVTLSACETGLSYAAHGDELMGLARAFLGAGARSLLVSLWPVYELPTLLFMEHFYQVWKGGATRAQAILDAQRHVQTIEMETLRRQLMTPQLSQSAINDTEMELRFFSRLCPGSQPFHHPYFWGGFLLVGDPS